MEAVFPPLHRLRLHPAKLACAKELHQLRARGREAGVRAAPAGRTGGAWFAAAAPASPGLRPCDTPSGLLGAHPGGEALGRPRTRLLLPAPTAPARTGSRRTSPTPGPQPPPGPHSQPDATAPGLPPPRLRRRWRRPAPAAGPPGRAATAGRPPPPPPPGGAAQQAHRTPQLLGQTCAEQRPGGAPGNVTRKQFLGPLRGRTQTAMARSRRIVSAAVALFLAVLCLGACPVPPAGAQPPWIQLQQRNRLHLTAAYPHLHRSSSSPAHGTLFAAGSAPPAASDARCVAVSAVVGLSGASFRRAWHLGPSARPGGWQAPVPAPCQSAVLAHGPPLTTLPPVVCAAGWKCFRSRRKCHASWTS